MKEKVLRIFAIIVIAIICFALLVGGANFYQSYIYHHPLEKELTKIEGLEVIELEQNKNRLVLEVQFNSREKLRQGFYLLLEHLQEQKKNKLEDCVLKINNASPNQELVSFIKKAKLSIYEAISTGHFTALPEQLTALAQQDNLTYDLEVDQQFIFVTVKKGENFAHLIINRGEIPLKIVTMGGGEFL
ncbi:MAG TPA: hypothetical protein GX532_00180 [Clostridia bacterium]|jgi:hypothetical protein|nr:hypothetical protein [Clostridia bacterium]